jgi:hypothetical protein
MDSAVMSGRDEVDGTHLIMTNVATRVEFNNYKASYLPL